MSIRPVACAAALAALALPALAQGASWHPGIKVAPFGSYPGAPSASLAPGGRALAAWTTTTGAVNPSRVEVRTRDGFTAPWTVVYRSPGYPRRPTAVAAAQNAAGAAVVAWRVPGGDVTSAVRATRTGRWQVLTVPSAVAVAAPDDFQAPVVALAADGSATLAWMQREGGVWVVRSARCAPGGAWTATPALVPARQPQRLVVDAAGDAAAVWVIPQAGTEQAFVPRGIVHVATRAAHGDWSAAYSPGETAAGADVAIGVDGRLALAWSAAGAGGTDPRITISRAASPGEPWGTGTAVAPGTTPRIALGATGVTVLAWAGITPGPGAPLRAAVDTGTGFTVPATLTTSESVSEVEVRLASVGVSGAGRAFVSWLDPLGPGAAYASTRSAGADGAWSGFDQSVGTDQDDIALAPGPADDALVLTPGEVAISNGDTIWAASYDSAVRPRLATSVRGVPVTGRRSVRWSVTIRNRGTVTARGVTLVMYRDCCSNPIVSSSPPGRRLGATNRIRWDLGALRPGAARVIRLVSVPGPRARAPYRVTGTLAAVALRTRAVGGTSAARAVTLVVPVVG